MKVALDYRPALFSRSGIARSVRELARALSQHETGLSLHLFGHALRRARFAETPEGSRLHRSRIPGRTLPMLRRLGWDASRLSGGSSLFHWTDYVYPPVGPRTPVVQTVHDLAFLSDPKFHGVQQSKILRARFERALSQADGIICPSAATARDLRAHYPDLAPIQVIPYGVDHVARHECDASAGRNRAATLLQSEAPYLLSLGTMEPRKNHATLLQAWRELPPPRPPLLFVGAPGWETAQLQCDLTKVQEGLAWTGEISDAHLFDLMAGARALVYPSSLEGFGFPPMEALELGVPPLVGDCNALREHLGTAALYVEGRDTRALRTGIQRIMVDETLRSQILDTWASRRHQFRWKACASAHREVYQAVLESSKRAELT